MPTDSEIRSQAKQIYINNIICNNCADAPILDCQKLADEFAAEPKTCCNGKLSRKYRALIKASLELKYANK